MIMLSIIALLQIVLESLPVSSSGHLLLLEQYMGMHLSKSLEYLLHGPTLGMLAVYFFGRWSFVLKNFWRLRTAIGHMVLYGICAEVATVVLYGAMQFCAPFFPVWLGFCMTGVALFSLRWVSWQPGSYQPLTLARAVVIGVIQGIAGLPGISRLGTTIVAGQWLGLAPRTAFLFSCMVQWPLMLAGFCYGVIQEGVPALGLIFFVALLLATVCAYFLLWWVELLCEQRRLWYFGVYMIALTLGGLCYSLFLKTGFLHSLCLH